MPTFSNTKINCFRNCPRQYFYRYVKRIKIPDAPDQIALFLGSRTHDALEWLYKQIMTGLTPGKEETVAKLLELWDGSWSDNIAIHEAGMTPSHYRSLATRCVEQYYDAHYPFDESVTIDVERNIFFKLDEERGINMTGFIDRLAKTPDGVWQIHDYKTSKGLPSQSEMDAEPQLAYYEIGVRQMWPDIERVELHWHYVRFGETIVSTRTPEQLEDLKQDALETIHDAMDREESEDAFEPVESGLCRYCDFQSICPVRKHLVTVEGLPANKYKKDPGVKLVDQWTEFAARKSELEGEIVEIDEEIDQIKEALSDFAERENIQVVAGSEKEVSVSKSDRLLLPRKGAEPDEYAELERLLRESGHWNKVSSPDHSIIRAVLKEPKEHDPALVELLKRFSWAESSSVMRLRSRK